MERKKKKREIFGPPPFGTPIFRVRGRHPRGPHPSRPHQTGPPLLLGPPFTPLPHNLAKCGSNKFGGKNDQMWSNQIGQMRSNQSGQMRSSKDGQIGFGQMQSRPIDHAQTVSPTGPVSRNTGANCTGANPKLQSEEGGCRLFRHAIALIIAHYPESGTDTSRCSRRDVPRNVSPDQAGSPSTNG